MHLLIVDNYDSFTYNLVHYFEELDCFVDVIKNDELDFKTISKYDAIVLSPGPGLPEESGKLMEVISEFYLLKPILGVCLGMQAIGTFFGGKLVNQKKVKHGKQELVSIIHPSPILNSIESPFKVGLYHSWEVQLAESCALISVAFSENDVLMVVQHSCLPIYGVQFHPESILTPNGKKIISNFLDCVKSSSAE
jgi:anthranilate synthase component 2